MSSPPLAWPVALLYASLRAAGRLPLPALHAIGRVIGELLWRLPGRPLRITTRNLSLVLTQESAKSRQRVARAALIETGKALTEVARIWGGDPANALALVREVRGEDLFRAALARGKGVIVAAPHLGCWELLNYWLASQAPLASMMNTNQTMDRARSMFAAIRRGAAFGRS
jgi:KDO2-lipid IV(A) lauroyltransferase